MDEVEYKLKSENVILVAEAIDILIQRVIDSSKDVLTAGNTSDLFDKLKEKCLSESKIVSLTACHGFKKLINCGYLTKSNAMSLVMTMLPNVKNYSCVIPIISEILISSVLDNLTTNNVFNSPWSLIPPQHPFIIVLQHHPESVQDILLETQAICQFNMRLSEHSLKLMRPVFIWLICYPTKSDFHIAQEMIKLLFQLTHDPLQSTVLFECISLQKISSKSSCLFSSKIIFEVANWASDNNHEEMAIATCLLLAEVSYYLIQYEHDPRPCFTLLTKILKNPRYEICAEAVLGILSTAVVICPITYIIDLLNLCKLASKKCSNSIVTLMLGSSLLHWLYHPLFVAEDVYKSLLKDLILDISTKTIQPSNSITQLMALEVVKAIKLSNLKIFTILELLCVHRKIVESQQNGIAWTKHCGSLTNRRIQQEINLFLQALLLEKDARFDKLKIFDTLLKAALANNTLAFGLLPTAIYATKITKEPSEMIEYIRGVSQLAFAKENVHSIVRFYEGLVNSKSIPHSFLIDIHVLLVDQQTRCYPYLQALLDDGKFQSGSKSEYFVAKAAAVKHICETRSASYGAELVPMISSILNRCTDSETSAGFCLALGALKALWLAHIVSPPSTWKVLSPKLKKDQRPAVQKSVCDLLSVVPQLKIEDSEYDTFVSDIISTFWHFAVDFHNPEVATAAFITLSTFKVQDITLKQIPSSYRSGIKLPSEFCKTPSDAARKPEDVLDYVPSECWGNCFKYANHETLSGISEMCYQFMCREIKDYRSGVYQTREQVEPSSADYLPPASVVRGIMEFLRKQVTSRSYDIFDGVLLECVTCLSRKFPKPLPPLNWYFLHDLFHGGKNFRYPCLMLATRQSVISISALKFINNYLRTETINEDTMNEMLSILPELCEVIPAVDITPMLSKLFTFAFENYFLVNNGDASEFTNVIKKCLSNEKTREDCFKMISTEISQRWEIIGEEHPGWENYVEMCCKLSSDSLEPLTSPSSCWELTEDIVKRLAYVRFKLAMSDDSDQSICWMNEIIDSGMQLPGTHFNILNSVLTILSIKKNASLKMWLLQLMAKTHVHMTEQSSSESSVTFLCDVLTVVIIVISQNYIFLWRDLDCIATSRSVRLDLFPQAVNMLLTNELWKDSEGQILEWLHHSKNSKMLPKEYSDTFYLAILSSRNCPYLDDIRVCNKFYNSSYHLTL